MFGLFGFTYCKGFSQTLCNARMPILPTILAVLLEEPWKNLGNLEKILFTDI